MLSSWDQCSLVSLVNEVDMNELLMGPCYECTLQRYDASRKSTPIEVNFVELSSFEVSGSFDPELFPVLGFDLHAFLCANVILFVRRLYTECDDFVSDVQIRSSVSVMSCDILNIFWKLRPSISLV